MKTPKLSDFKAGQRVRANDHGLGDNGGIEGVVTFVHEHRAGQPDEVNVLWDGAVTPMPCTIANLEIIAGATMPGPGGIEG